MIGNTRHAAVTAIHYDAGSCSGQQGPAALAH
jgi:hypothetical protein